MTRPATSISQTTSFKVASDGSQDGYYLINYSVRFENDTNFGTDAFNRILMGVRYYDGSSYSTIYGESQIFGETEVHAGASLSGSVILQLLGDRAGNQYAIRPMVLFESDTTTEDLQVSGGEMSWVYLEGLAGASSSLPTGGFQNAFPPTRWHRRDLGWALQPHHDRCQHHTQRSSRCCDVREQHRHRSDSS